MKHARYAPLPALLRLLFLSFPLLLLLQGCAGNIVRLSYPAPANEAVDANKGTVTVCVVDFENRRDKSTIGESGNGRPILPRTGVERWMAEGLGKELKRAGYHVVMTETLEDALAASPAYIVTGEAEEVWMAESLFARYTATIRGTITLCDGKGEYITASGNSSVFSRSVLPFSGVPQTLLDDALYEMLQPVARMLTRSMQ